MSTVVVRLEMRVLDRILREHPQEASRIVRSTAFEVEGKAKMLAPVDTGALKNSLHTDMVDSLEARVSDGVEYGIYQEMGTRKMAAHPFMIPAAEWVRPRWLDRWKELCR